MVDATGVNPTDSPLECIEDPTATPASATSPATAPADEPGARGRQIAYLSYSDGLHDARTFRMARTAVEAGYAVTVYARWYPGLPVVERRDGYRLVRAPWSWHLVIPGLRGRARRRAAAAMVATNATDVDRPSGRERSTRSTTGRESSRDLGTTSTLRRPWTFLARPFERYLRLLRMFPLHPLGWSIALEDVAEPADIWHGMWAGSLPALGRLRGHYGGRTIYDARDVYMRSRGFVSVVAPLRWFLARLERRWAQAADQVITVNASYADLLEEQLRILRPPVIMNVPERWDPPEPPPNLIRAALGVDAATRIALYQGGLMTGRGIEESMDAILQVPGAILCLLGYGALRDRLAAACAAPPYLGRVMLLEPVSPSELLEWTASADVSVMAIQPTSVNHRYTTPQKLFESIAAGVPVVASDLPGMAEIVRATDVGVLCDPTSPTAIAAAIRAVLEAPEEERRARRAQILQVAHERYAWEFERGALLDVYTRLLEARSTSRSARSKRSIARS